MASEVLDVPFVAPNDPLPRIPTYGCSPHLFMLSDKQLLGPTSETGQLDTARLNPNDNTILTTSTCTLQYLAVSNTKAESLPQMLFLAMGPVFPFPFLVFLSMDPCVSSFQLDTPLI